jgi:hypothetical protein
MAEQFEALQGKHIDFIQQQHLFFVGTAGRDGFVNVSPKGMDSFRVISPNQIVWLNLTGSGNETAAHVLENGRMTIMFCSFDKQPLILRLYGDAKAVHSRDEVWGKLSELFPKHSGTRQFFILDLEMVQTSCGYAVPFYELVGERTTLTKWADKKGQTGIESYWKEKNTKSLNGKETGILENSDACKK